jgi:hypothetical protein
VLHIYIRSAMRCRLIDLCLPLSSSSPFPMADLDVCSAGPVPNLDVSGIGVRTAVYVQAVAMGTRCRKLLSFALTHVSCALAFVIREGEVNDREDAVRALSFFNIVFAVGILYCGLNSKPSITLYECVIEPSQAD